MLADHVSMIYPNAATHVAEDHGEETHATNATNSPCLIHPMVPPVSEHRDPALGDQGLYEHEHGEGKRHERKWQVSQHGRDGRKCLLRPRVRIRDE